MLRTRSFKGADVRLESGDIIGGSHQPVPYPAIVWDWRCVQSYAWNQSGHINVLELLAFLNYLKKVTADERQHSSRILHVLDSNVSACVVAKGRSSSRLRNRILRRVGALSLGADVYCFPVWTISAWNFSDAGSRAWVGPDGIT